MKLLMKYIYSLYTLLKTIHNKKKHKINNIDNKVHLSLIYKTSLVLNLVHPSMKLYFDLDNSLSMLLVNPLLITYPC